VRLSDALRIASKSLSERRLRAALTIMGIAIGPLALVMMTSVVQGYSSYVIGQIELIGQRLIVVTPGSGFKLTQDDLDFFRKIDGVERAEPFYSTRGFAKVGGKEKEIFIYALPLDMLFQVVGGLEVKEGEIPPSGEIVKALVGYNIAFSETDERQLSLGDVITVTVYNAESGGKVTTKRFSVMVAGILEKYGGAFLLSPDETLFLNLEAGRKLLGLKDWSGILIIARNTSVVSYITNTIRDSYGDNVNVISFLGIAKIISSITGAMDFITFSTSLSAFAVAVAGVAATMITSVIERTREIGVMKAIGFTDGQVLLLILLESIIMGLIGGSMGIALGALGAHVLASRGFVVKSVTATLVIKASPKIDAFLIGRTVALTLAISVIGGIFPAYRAAKIPPATALRYE